MIVDYILTGSLLSPSAATSKRSGFVPRWFQEGCPSLIQFHYDPVQFSRVCENLSLSFTFEQGQVAKAAGFALPDALYQYNDYRKLLGLRRLNQREIRSIRAGR
jgi:hypothetical protein